MATNEVSWKGWWKSKTMWSGIACVVLSKTPVAGLVAENPETCLQITGLLFSGLRLVTRKALKWFQAAD